MECSALETPARSVLGSDLPLIDDDVTVEHLLSHRSGIGDYLDEDAEPDLGDYLMPVPVHELATTEQYLVVLDGHPAKFAPGDGFSYCNGGLRRARADRRAGERGAVPRPRAAAGVRAGGHGRHRLPALRRAAGPRRARLPRSRRATRTNVFHLPVRGQWRRRHLHDGRPTSAASGRRSSPDASFPSDWVAEMVRPRSVMLGRRRATASGSGSPAQATPCGWRATDAGVSFRSWHRPGNVTHLHRRSPTPPMVRGPWRALSRRDSRAERRPMVPPRAGRHHHLVTARRRRGRRARRASRPGPRR